MDKRHILQEIKRTGDGNGGIALGQERFARETGIRDSEWRGKYWVRWSEAVHEAGFEPNQLQAAFTEELVLSHLVSVTRELGRLPVFAELRLRSRTHPGFPAHNTFTKLGTKKQWATKVLAYCRSHEGWEDVAAICATVPDASREQAEGEHREEVGPIFGFVYLMKAGRFYKIGRSNSVGRREYELGIQLPERASTVHTIKTDDPTGIEAYWHKRFEAKRKNGEWFELGTGDVKAFRRRKFM